MGDRVSIAFEHDGEVSVTLFSHWRGKDLVESAKTYAVELAALRTKLLISDLPVQPLDRLEPATVMVDFIRAITSGVERVESDLYLGATSWDGDNTDNGHFLIHLSKTGDIEVEAAG